MCDESCLHGSETENKFVKVYFLRLKLKLKIIKLFFFINLYKFIHFNIGFNKNLNIFSANISNSKNILFVYLILFFLIIQSYSYDITFCTVPLIVYSTAYTKKKEIIKENKNKSGVYR